MLAGEADFILKVVSADWDSYTNFTTELTSAPNVSHVKSARHSHIQTRWNSYSDRESGERHGLARAYL